MRFKTNMSIYIHKTGINKTLGQQSDTIISADLIGDFQPDAGINSAYWDNQASGNNNLRRYNSITHNNSTPHNFEFDGTDDYLGEASEGYGGSSFNVDAAGDFTIAQWVKIPNGKSHYVNITDATNTAWCRISIYIDNSGGSLIGLNVVEGASDESAYAPYNSTALVPDTWYYIAVTHDGSGNYKTYVNGSTQDNSLGSTTFALGASSANNALVIGKETSSYSGASIKLGHVHVYTAALTNSQIRQNFLATHKIHSDRIYGGTYTA